MKNVSFIIKLVWKHRNKNV